MNHIIGGPISEKHIDHEQDRFVSEVYRGGLRELGRLFDCPECGMEQGYYEAQTITWRFGDKTTHAVVCAACNIRFELSEKSYETIYQKRERRDDKNN